MESVLAAGILRHTADAFRNGKDVDTALREASQGAPKNVHDIVLAHIRDNLPKKGKVTAETIGQAILEAERRLQ